MAGATRGAGRAIAVELARAGAVVYAKAAVQRMALAQSHELAPYQGAAVAADPDVARWTGTVVSSGQLAPLYGFTDTDDTQPDCWRYVVEVQDRGLAADDTGYR